MKIGNTATISKAFNIERQKEGEESRELDRDLAKKSTITPAKESNSTKEKEFLSQIGTLGVGIKNANEAVGVLQIVDNALEDMSKNASRLEQIQYTLDDSSLNSAQKSMLESEASALLKELTQAVNSATYNGKNVFYNSVEFFGDKESIELNINPPAIESISFESRDSIADFMSSLSSSKEEINLALRSVNILSTNHLSAISDITKAKSDIEYGNTLEDFNSVDKERLIENASMYRNSFDTSMLQDKIGSLLA